MTLDTQVKTIEKQSNWMNEESRHWQREFLVSGPSTKGYVLDYSKHEKQNNPDSCGFLAKGTLPRVQLPILSF